VRSLLDEIKAVPVGELTPYPGNPRRGDVDMIAESLAVNQQYAPLIVQRSTGYVLTGNHTLQAAVKLGWETVHVAYVDVGQKAARKIMLSANRTADLGGYDAQDLTELLQGLAGELQGTGYTTGFAEDLSSLTSPPRHQQAALGARNWGDWDENDDDSPVFLPEIHMTVTPEAHARWRRLLDAHYGSGDAEKLNGLLDEIQAARGEGFLPA
jgi:hypothetical protein